MQLVILDLIQVFLYGEAASGDSSFFPSTKFSGIPF